MFSSVVERDPLSNNNSTIQVPQTPQIFTTQVKILQNYLWKSQGKKQFWKSVNKHWSCDRNPFWQHLCCQTRKVAMRKQNWYNILYIFVYSMNETFLAVFEALYFCCLMTCHDMTYIIWKPDALATITCHQFGHPHLCLLCVFTFLIFILVLLS